MRETTRFEIRIKQLDVDNDGTVSRVDLVIPLITADIFGGSLIMGPPEAASQIQEVLCEAFLHAPELITASLLYLVTPNGKPNEWLLQRLELEPEFKMYPVSWDHATYDVVAAFHAADALSGKPG